LQERNYPQQKIPIILPFLSDGILALGGTKAEGIFRVPGDSDSVSELKLRIDKGYYNLDGVDDPHVLASLLKLWLRELCDPLVPHELYNDCITHASDPDACIGVVERLPTINRRVVLFVVSFLQLFLDERMLAATKMTSANLALVMAPNLLRCSSESMAVVFTNAQCAAHLLSSCDLLLTSPTLQIREGVCLQLATASQVRPDRPGLRAEAWARRCVRFVAPARVQIPYSSGSSVTLPREAPTPILLHHTCPLPPRADFQKKKREEKEESRKTDCQSPKRARTYPYCFLLASAPPFHCNIYTTHFKGSYVYLPLDI